MSTAVCLTRNGHLLLTVGGRSAALTKDEARALSVQLDDACDEIELAEAVSES